MLKVLGKFSLLLSLFKILVDEKGFFKVQFMLLSRQREIIKKRPSMNEQEKLLMPEESSKRKRKILTDPESLWAKCKVCKEVGNLENMIRQGLEVKDGRGVVLYGSFEYVYFCSEACRGLF